MKVLSSRWNMYTPCSPCFLSSWILICIFSLGCSFAPFFLWNPSLNPSLLFLQTPVINQGISWTKLQQKALCILYTCLWRGELLIWPHLIWLSNDWSVWISLQELYRALKAKRWSAYWACAANQTGWLQFWCNPMLCFLLAGNMWPALLCPLSCFYEGSSVSTKY